jgi:putative ABC transport system permease protein
VAGVRRQPALTLRGVSGQAGRLRVGRLFVAVQAAFAFCLVVTGAAFLFSLRNLNAVDPGFDAHGVTVRNLSAETQKEPEPVRLSVIRDTAARIAGVAGVQRVGLAAWPILKGTGWSEQVIIPGKGPSDREEIFYGITPNYFATLRTPLVHGRDFDAHDSFDKQPVATIVNLAFARKYFNTDAVVGSEFERSSPRSRIRHAIVGVVANAYFIDLKHSAEPIVYVPFGGDSGFTA